MARFPQPGCCCSVGCNAIQLWSRTIHNGFAKPNLAGITGSGVYNSSGGGAAWNALRLAIPFIQNDLQLLIAATYYSETQFFPPNSDQAFLPGYTGKDIYTALEIRSRYWDETTGNIDVNCYLRLIIDPTLGYCTNLLASYSYYDTVSASTITEDFSYGLSLSSGEITTAGTSSARTAAASSISGVTNDLHALFLTYGESLPAGWELVFNAFDNGAGNFSGEYHLTNASDPAHVYHTILTFGTGGPADELGAARAANNLLMAIDASPEVGQIGGIFDVEANYVSTSTQWNNSYWIVDSLLALQFSGAGRDIVQKWPLDAESNFFTPFPRRTVIVKADLFGIYPLPVAHTSYLGWNIFTAPLINGQTYFGRWWSNDTGTSSYTWAIFSMATIVEVQTQSRCLQINEQSPSSSWTYSSPWPIDVKDCNGDYFLPAGRHYLRPGNLIYTFGIGLVQRRTWFDNADWSGNVACYTMPDYIPVSEEFPDPHAGWGWDTFNNLCTQIDN